MRCIGTDLGPRSQTVGSTFDTAARINKLVLLAKQCQLLWKTVQIEAATSLFRVIAYYLSDDNFFAIPILFNIVFSQPLLNLSALGQLAMLSSEVSPRLPMSYLCPQLPNLVRPLP